eukprot:scaffold36.g5066.t1
MRRLLVLTLLAVGLGGSEARQRAAAPSPAPVPARGRSSPYERGATYVPFAGPRSKGEALAATSAAATVPAIAFQVVLPNYTVATFTQAQQDALLQWLAKAAPGVKFDLLGVEGNEDESASAYLQAAFVSGAATPAALAAKLQNALDKLLPASRFGAPDGRVPVHLEGLSPTYLARAGGAAGGAVAGGVPGTRPALLWFAVPWNKGAAWFRGPQRAAYTQAILRASPGANVTLTTLTDSGYTAADGAVQVTQVVLNTLVATASRAAAAGLARKVAQGLVFPPSAWGEMHFEGPTMASLVAVQAGRPIASLSTTGTTAILTLVPPSEAGSSKIKRFRVLATAAGRPSVLATSPINSVTLRGLAPGVAYTPPSDPRAPSIQGITSLPGGKTQVLITPPASGPQPYRYKLTVTPVTSGRQGRRLHAEGVYFTAPGSDSLTLPSGAIPPGGAIIEVEGVDVNNNSTTPSSQNAVFSLPRYSSDPSIVFPGEAGVAAATLEGRALSIVVRPPAAAPGAPPILSYVVKVEPRVATGTFFEQTFPAAVTTYEFSPLTRNTTYTVFVYAVNRNGVGTSAPWDVSVPPEPDTLPRLLGAAAAPSSLVANGSLPPEGGPYASCLFAAVGANGLAAATCTKRGLAGGGAGEQFTCELSGLQPDTAYNASTFPTPQPAAESASLPASLPAASQPPAFSTPSLATTSQPPASQVRACFAMQQARPHRWQC